MAASALIALTASVALGKAVTAVQIEPAADERGAIDALGIDGARTVRTGARFRSPAPISRSSAR
jgi:hypothetical protein